MDGKDVDATGRAVVLNKMFPKEDAIEIKVSSLTNEW
jgi:hypothetical protein